MWPRLAWYVALSLAVGRKLFANARNENFNVLYFTFQL